MNGLDNQFEMRKLVTLFFLLWFRHMWADLYSLFTLSLGVIGTLYSVKK